MVYCTCFIKTVRVFTVSAESLPRRSHTHSDTPTQHPYYSPMHPHHWDVRVKTLKIRQLLGDRVDLFFNFFFLKREKHGGMHLAIIMLMKFVYINIYMAVTLNIPFTFYIHRMTSRFYSQQNIPISVSMLLCSDFRIHIGAFPKNNSSLCKWNKAQLILIWSRGRKGIKTSFKWSCCWGISFDLNPPEIHSSNFQRFLRNKGFLLFPDKIQKEKLGIHIYHFNVSVALTT